MRLRKRVDMNIFIAEAFTTVSYPLIATFDLILKVSRHPYDWEAIRSMPTAALYMVLGPELYPTLGDPRYSLSTRSQAANIFLPLNIIDTFLPFAFLASIALLFTDNILLSRTTKRNLGLIISLSFLWCLLVDMAFAAKITGRHPNGERNMGILYSMAMFMFLGGKLVWAFNFYLIPMPRVSNMLVVPILYGLVWQLLLFVWALVRWDHDMSTALGRHTWRFLSHIFDFVLLLLHWPAALFMVIPSAWVPEFPDLGLMLGDLDQAAALGVAVVLAVYSLCDTLGWKPWRRSENIEYTHLDELERTVESDGLRQNHEDRGTVSYPQRGSGHGSSYLLQPPGSYRYKD
ncbi:hypothetical protein ACHAPT_001323 [Fusarium lateritium]